MNEPRISAVVLTYNRRREVLATLEHLQAALDAAPTIVVDNGSTDGTVDAIARRFPEVELVRAPANLGAAGRNLGVARVRTRYVAFGDDDTQWEAGALERAADILDAAPQVAVLSGQVLVGPDGRVDPTCTAMTHSPLGTTAHGPRLLGFLAGACVMRTAVYRAVGGYWPRFFIGGEEQLMALDIVALGWDIVYADTLRSRHFPSNARDAGQRRRLLARNAIWTAWLRLPVRDAFARSTTILRETGNAGSAMRTAAAALLGMPHVLRHRRVLPARCLHMYEQLAQHPP
ncbi:glycosyltransferase [Verticiella sediminum]|uniref:Glycosyltransferase n=1 Tax=Verticiella sediminum TaxID=1247510 RepID=A0A556AF45_9BURK|nr:glycosyltransferase [Verticiella sediminum]TSH91516.1 glycosyltransferase [Verticiella sediminum]